MRMQKASEADIAMTTELCSAFEALNIGRWNPTVPDCIAKLSDPDDEERFSLSDPEQCERVLRYLLQVAGRASLFRVLGCVVTLLDPANRCVDPALDYLDHHPDTVAAHAAKTPRPVAEWDESMGAVLWWQFPINEPPWCGTPLDHDWPGYHTHFTPVLVPDAPDAPASSADAGQAGQGAPALTPAGA